MTGPRSDAPAPLSVRRQARGNHLICENAGNSWDRDAGLFAVAFPPALLLAMADPKSRSPAVTGSQPREQEAGAEDEAVPETAIEPRAYRWDPRKGWSLFATRVALIALIAVVLGILWLSRAVLVGLVFALLLTFLLEPPVSYFKRRWKVPRVLTAIVILQLTATLLILGSIALAPIMVEQFAEIGAALSQVSDGALALLRWLAGLFSGISILGVDLGPPIEDLQSRLQPGRLGELFGDGGNVGSARAFLSVMTGALASLVGSAATFIITLALAVVFAVYLAHDLPRLSAVLAELIPPDQMDDLRQLGGHLSDVWKGFFKGQILLGAAFGVLVALTMFALGLPAALLMGLIAGLMDLVPTLGALVAGGLVVAVALVQGSTWLGISNLWFALLVLGVYTLLQWVEGGLLQPRILGGSVRLPGSIAIIGIVIGAASAGVLGAYLAVPLIASGREIFLYFKHKYEESMAKRELLVSQRSSAGGSLDEL